MEAWIERARSENFKLYGIMLEAGDSVADVLRTFLKALGRPPIGRISSAFEALLAQPRDIRSIIIESGYFDLDVRSEDAILVERQFTFDRPLTLRIHFFTSLVTRTTFRAWQVEEDTETPVYNRDYVGYVVPRTRRGTVTLGRTLISPPARSKLLAKPESLGSRVRTVVREDVNVAGVSLTAQGVPFMQQDGALLSCAHVTAWMAHFSAVLQGFAPRVAVAKVRDDEPVASKFGRQYPTQGLADEQILRSLILAGLAPELIYADDLSRPRDVAWYDRPEIHRNPAEHSWGAETLTSTIARYLNSGFPALYSIGDHTRLICGYVRNDDLAHDPTIAIAEADGESSAVSHFIIHDESTEAYQLAPIESFLTDEEDQTIILPLPHGLALSGSDAELIGAAAFERRCNKLLGSQDLDDVSNSPNAVAKLEETKELMDSHKLSVRTYASWGTDFKRSIRTRANSEEYVQVVSLARLPRFVWVVEVIDRAARGRRESPVIGEVVIDATATSLDSAPEIIIRVPGHVEIRDPVTGDTQGWLMDTPPHDSGRWAQSVANPLWYGSVANRSKVIGAL